MTQLTKLRIVDVTLVASTSGSMARAKPNLPSVYSKTIQFGQMLSLHREEAPDR